MPNDLTTRPPHDIQQPGADILTPLASRSLFWRARYLEASPVLCHIPLLFWLTEAVRPRVAVTLGVADAVPHFALCQAVDKLGIDSFCTGLEPAPEEDGEPEDLSKQTSFNEANFADFSQILQQGAGSGNGLAPDTRIDLLIVNRPVTQALISDLDTIWLPQLSERSIIVFLHDGETTGYQSYIRHLSATGSIFSCGLDSRASVVFHGPEQNERLQRLASLKTGQPGYLAARNVFARLGELHSKTERLAFKTNESSTARRQRDQKAAELAAAQAETQKIAAQNAERSSLVAAAQAEAFDLGQAVKDLEGKLSQSQGLLEEQQKHAGSLEIAAKEAQAEKDRLREEKDRLQEELKQLKDALSDRLDDISSLGLALEAQKQENEILSAELGRLQSGTADAERDKLKKLAAEQEESLGERYEDIAALGLEIQKRTAERDAAREEAEELKRRLGETEHLRDMHAGRVHALEGSTSWRVTAPLRKISLSLKRTPEEG